MRLKRQLENYGGVRVEMERLTAFLGEEDGAVGFGLAGGEDAGEFGEELSAGKVSGPVSLCDKTDVT